MMHDLFDLRDEPPGVMLDATPVAPGAVLLRGFCLSAQSDILDAIRRVADAAPFRHMVTPGGFTMSAAMTNCGAVGWVSDRAGYRYEANDPESGKPWPAMPPVIRDIAATAAAAAGFGGFVPDACLINRYAPGAKLSLHQDKDESGFDAPIVSVSLGLPAVFQFGGLKRSDKLRRVPLRHGDIVVWGGPARLAYHGVLPLKDGQHPAVGRYRINLTLRKAL